MPFRSRAQQRAAFGGHIPGFSKKKAKEWADETDFDVLPERVKESSPARVAYIAKKLREQLSKPDTGKNVYDAVQTERDHSRRKHSELVAFCTKIAFAVPKPGQIMGANRVGGFSGKATTNFLKPPGSITASVTNPRLGLRNAMTKANRV